MLTVQELRDAIANGEIIKNDVLKVLLELDTTPSVTTQASLNDMVVELYQRVKATGDIYFEFENEMKKLNAGEFIAWIRDNFTDHSYEMFLDTIKEED